MRFNRERMKEREGNRCETVSIVDNNQRCETEAEVAGVFFLSDITLVQRHKARTEIKTGTEEYTGEVKRRACLDLH